MDSKEEFQKRFNAMCNHMAVTEGGVMVDRNADHSKCEFCYKGIPGVKVAGNTITFRACSLESIVEVFVQSFQEGDMKFVEVIEEMDIYSFAESMFPLLLKDSIAQQKDPAPNKSVFSPQSGLVSLGFCLVASECPKITSHILSSFCTKLYSNKEFRDSVSELKPCSPLFYMLSFCRLLDMSPVDYVDLFTGILENLEKVNTDRTGPDKEGMAKIHKIMRMIYSFADQMRNVVRHEALLAIHAISGKSENRNDIMKLAFQKVSILVCGSVPASADLSFELGRVCSMIWLMKCKDDEVWIPEYISGMFGYTGRRPIVTIKEEPNEEA